MGVCGKAGLEQLGEVAASAVRTMYVGREESDLKPGCISVPVTEITLTAALVSYCMIYNGA